MIHKNLHLTFTNIHISNIFKDGVRLSHFFIPEPQNRCQNVRFLHMFIYIVLRLTCIDFQISAIL